MGIYMGAIILILSIVAHVEAKKKNKKMPFFRRKRPQMSSMGSGRSSFSSNSNFGRSSSFGGSSFGSRGSSSLGSFGSRGMSKDDASASASTKTAIDEKKKKPITPKMTVDHSPVPKGVTYGPRSGRPGVVSGTRYVQGRRPLAYGYYTGRFPVWMTSYAVIMETMEECHHSN